MRIDIVKAEERGEAVVYQFGTAGDIVGKVVARRDTGEVFLIEIDDGDNIEFYLTRVEQVMFAHVARGEFPDRTEYVE